MGRSILDGTQGRCPYCPPCHPRCTQTLPPGPYLSSLRRLELAGSDLLCIPPALAAASRLHSLDLSRNSSSRLRLGTADLSVS